MSKNYFDENGNYINVEHKSLAEIYMEGVGRAADEQYERGYRDGRAEAFIYPGSNANPEGRVEFRVVRHGRWKTKVIHDTYCFQCSACNSIYNGDTHYCPHCGAKMDGGTENGKTD